MSLWGFLCRFAVFARWMWRKVLFQSVDSCILCWPCCWARCWMLQDMYHMEASCDFYVKVSKFDQLEQSNISVLTVISLGIVMRTIHYDWMANEWFMSDPGNVLRQTSPDVLSIEECPFYLYQHWDISCHSSRWIPVTKGTTADWLTATGGTVGIPCSYTQPDPARIEGARWLSVVPLWLGANYSIFSTTHLVSWSSSLPFHNSTWWLQKYFSQVREKPNRAEWHTLQTMRHPVTHSHNADIS